MKLLVIGTDTTIFQPGSDARRRIKAYGRLFDELHIVICSGRNFERQDFGSVRLYPTNSRIFFLCPFDAARIGRRIIQEHGIDVISVQDPAESGLAGWLVKRRTSLPLHIQLHTDVVSPYFRRNSWKELMRYWLARFTIPRGDYFRVVSRRVGESLHSAFGIPHSRVSVLPIFVDRRAVAAARPVFRLRERYPQFDFIILMVSRLNRDKRIDVALAAFAEFRKAFPGTGLVIVGDGPERKNLESRIQNLELTAWVRFEGWREDLIPYYKGADLYLLTSAFEGYGRTVVEAAASGLPVVMTDVGVAGEIIRDGETGRVVPVGNRAALVRALVLARREYPTVRRMAERAQREVLAMEPWTWEGYLDLYRKSYENLLRHKR